jgi:hypothetical protein
MGEPKLKAKSSEAATAYLRAGYNLGHFRKAIFGYRLQVSESFRPSFTVTFPQFFNFHCFDFQDNSAVHLGIGVWIIEGVRPSRVLSGTIFEPVPKKTIILNTFSPFSFRRVTG